MDTKKSIQWIQSNNLASFGALNYTYLEKIFNQCVNAKNEDILIIGDTGFTGQHISSVLSYAYYLAASKMNFNPQLILQKQKTRGQEADDDVINALDSLNGESIIIVNVSDKLGGLRAIGKSFRGYCRAKKHRFISSTGLGYLPTSRINELIYALDVDYKELQKKHLELKKKLDDAKELHVTTLAGTDLWIDIKNVKAVSADGIYDKPGSGGNLPAGEVYIAPNNVEGTAIIDASSRNRLNTRLIRKPIKIIIEKGYVTDIIDGQKAQLLKRALEWAESKAMHPERVKRVAEFGIGINPYAKILGSTIVDEKSLGTAHIGIGSNYWFGGPNKTIIHLDQVFRNPRIEADGEVLRV